MFVQPDLQWYTNISERKSATPRCPFATVERCPRYYQSISLLGDVGITTKIPPKEDERLLKGWLGTEVWPKVKEQATSVSGRNNGLFSNFCPEVTFDTFGLFAVSCSRFVDEIDRNARHRALSMSGAAHGHDWRWNWEHVHEQHYTECPLYSILHKKPITVTHSGEEVLKLRPEAYGVSIDIKVLWSKLTAWLKKKAK